MSKPVLDDLFTAHGRRNRKSFLWLNLLLALTFAEGVFILLLDYEFGWGFAETGFPAVLIILYSLCWSAAVGLATAQRYHDCGWSGYWALFLYVPYLGGLAWLAALMAPGQSGANYYGVDPLRRRG